ncbi:MAG: TrkH family potassium uptake protein [Pseudoprimorskyibacter sp.]|jgi:trk system potassium uptake protein TrkH|nr:TrkH family potassium uptake protein [Pseudoprimorskyibacter sp.]
MFDVRPVGYVIGWMVIALGVAMLPPFLVDFFNDNSPWVFLESAAVTILIGGFTVLATANGVTSRLSIQQTFLLTTGVWVVLPVFGAVPFVLGATDSSYTDGFFEAMSGLTTTGSTVFSGLDQLPQGLLLWRGLLQWIGGIGIIVVAMVFLPELRVGGMQVFRTEGFDTMGKILPRATQISSSISSIYLGLTLACMLAYGLTGMSWFEATVHALTTVSTGGFGTSDTSFATYSGATQYVAVVFMILAALPFVRYVQMIAGDRLAITRDAQSRAFVITILVLVALASLALWNTLDHGVEQAFRESLFNITSIISGTGYASADYMAWGPFLVAVFFFIGLIGGCAGSTACSVKIFRYQILFASVKLQLQRIRSPHGVFVPRFEGRRIGEDVLSSVMSFFVFFVVTLGLFTVALALTGLDFITSLSGAAAALGNIGPGLGDEIGPSGNFGGLNDTAKWLLSAAMLLGRLELLAVFAIFTIKFWRD